MIRAYNGTPENFGVPSDETINETIRLVEQQMEIDSRIEQPFTKHLPAAQLQEGAHSVMAPSMATKERQQDELSAIPVGRVNMMTMEEQKVSEGPEEVTVASKDNQLSV